MSQSNERPIEKDGITFPPFAPKLKLERRPTDKWAANLAEERTRLEGEQGTLREREQNLQKQEERLRKIEKDMPPRDAPAAAAPKQVTAAPFHRPGSAEPFGGDQALHLGWDQLHRARGLFESEQEGLRRDRAGLRQFAEELKVREAKLDAREESVALREQAVADREATLAATPPPAEAAPAPAEESTVARLTKAPFAIARSVLGPKK
jgi:hypothetical protein